MSFGGRFSSFRGCASFCGIHFENSKQGILHMHSSTAGVWNCIGIQHLTNHGFRGICLVALNLFLQYIQGMSFHSEIPACLIFNYF